MIVNNLGGEAICLCAQVNRPLVESGGMLPPGKFCPLDSLRWHLVYSQALVGLPVNVSMLSLSIVIFVKI